MLDKNSKHNNKEMIVCVLEPQLKCYYKTSKLVHILYHSTCILFYLKD